jgi:hypothetical protein
MAAALGARSFGPFRGWMISRLVPVLTHGASTYSLSPWRGLPHASSCPTLVSRTLSALSLESFVKVPSATCRMMV